MSTKKPYIPKTPVIAHTVAEQMDLVRALEKDHEPDGWPAVRMAQLTAMAVSLKYQRQQIEMLCRSWAETHTYIEKLAQECGVDQARIDGDSYGIPGVEELVNMIIDVYEKREDDRCLQESEILGDT